MADAIVRWTARLFVVCYAGRLCIDAANRRDAVSQRRARWLWTAGCLICLIHFAVSFHLVHAWSDADAYEHVRRRTFESTGISSGFGLYINYAFGLIWLIDAALWWRRLDWSEQRIPYWIVQSLFAFLISQATVAFGPRFWIPVAILFVAILTGLRWYARETMPLSRSSSTSKV